MRPFLLAAVFVASTAVQAEVVFYPGPKSLEDFQNLRASERYQVTVNDQPVFVYASRNRTGNDTNGKPIPAGYIAEAHFCYFSFKDEPVTVAVTVPADVDPLKVTVHPLRRDIRTTVEGRTVRFTMDQPRKLVVKTNPEELAPLVLLADEPDTGIPTGPDVLRFGPGNHDIGLQYKVHDGQTVYLDGGAIVKGSFFKPKEEGPLRRFTLRGRGIIYCGDYEFKPRRAGWGRGITGWEAGLEHGRIEGVIMLDGVHWNTGFDNQESEFTNLKIIGWHGNTDGVRVGANSRARDCFVMNNDDSLLPEGIFPEGTSGSIEDCVVWHHAWGRPFKMLNFTPPESDGIHHFTYRNIDILETGVGKSAVVFLSPQSSGDAVKPRGPTHDILFENIYIERATNLFELRPPTDNRFYRVTFRNIHTPVANGVIEGQTEDHTIQDITIENLIVNGKKVRSIEETDIKVGPHVKNLVVK